MKTHQINLGQCSSKLDALHKIHAWAKKSKSFTINRIRRESYVIDWGSPSISLQIKIAELKKQLLKIKQ